ncbi:tetratricopeptide repeat protein [Micromonospora orduensis]|uniref:tetratricopeptide repeat protein n=1 Tax=Micromonospora orduensis TaxID=1420891 RepID=UPI0038232B8C
MAESKPVSVVVIGGLAATVGAFAPTLYERASLLVRRVDFRAVATVEPPSVVWLLNPSQQVVPFRGRDAELRQLSAWCADRRSAVVHLVFAPGGFGKTRLALRLRDELIGRGWQCVFVRPGGEGQAAQEVTSDRAPGRLLLVVDYAESRAPGGLAQLLAAASLRRVDRVRVLLLARTAGPWWTTLSATVHEHAALLDALTGDRRNLTALGARIDARLPAEVVAHAAEVFGRKLKRPVPADIENRRYPGGAPVLRLHAAALVAVLGGSAEGYGRGDVLEEVLGHERRYWRASANRQRIELPADETEADALLARVVGVAALFGADDEQGVVDLVGRALPGMAGGGAEVAYVPAAHVRWVRWLRGLYPADDNLAAGRLGTLQPDLLAEHLAVEVLAACTVAQRETLFRGLAVGQAVQALTLLGRAAAGHAGADDADVDGLIREALAADVPTMAEAVVQVAVQFPGRYASRMAKLLSERPPPELGWLRDLARRVPYPSLELHWLALALTTLITSNDTADAAADRASWRNWHVLRLTEAGRRVEALSTSSEAVDLDRGLVQVNRDAYLPDLAGSVNNHANLLAMMGRPAEALSTSSEAVDLHRELVQVNRDAYLPDLAGSVNNHALRLAAMGRRAEALATSTEAVQLRRELAQRNRDAHLPDLAGSVSNQAVLLAEAGRRAEAVSTSSEAVDLFQELVQVNRDAYLPDLAMSVNNHALRLAAMGRPDEALTISAEAVQLRRELAQLNRDAYLPNLATSVNNHANRLAEADRPDEALTISTEAVKLRRELAQLNRDAHLPDLAMSVNNHALRLAAMGRPDEALTISAEAVKLRRELAQLNRQAYLPDLAGSVNNHAQRLAEAGRRAEALSTNAEAVDLFRELVQVNRDAYLPDLAKCLWTAGWMRLMLQDPEQGPIAIEATTEALRIYTDLATTEPEVFASLRDATAKALNQLTEQ